jgi:FdhD protein
LFTQAGALLYFVEDVGRHNAVDSIAGKMWLDGVDGGDKVFYTTGRLTSEMVIKGAQMSIPFLLSRSGTTQMGHQVASRLGMALLARCTGRHFLLLTAAERLIPEPELATAEPVASKGSGPKVAMATLGPDPLLATDATVGGGET